MKDISEFDVYLDNEPIFSSTFSNDPNFSESFADPGGVTLRRGVNLGFALTGDSAFDMGLHPDFLNIPHTANTLTVKWMSIGNAGPWGLDNVEVILHGGPYAASVVEVPPSGWYSTTGKSQEVSFNSLGEIETGIDFGNIQVVDLDLGGERVVEEGSLIEFDTGLDVADYAFQWQVTADNGDLPAFGNLPTFSFTPLDEGTYTVSLTVTNQVSGLQAQPYQVTVNVTNAAPTVTAADDQIVLPGQVLNLRLADL